MSSNPSERRTHRLLGGFAGGRGGDVRPGSLLARRAHPATRRAPVGPAAGALGRGPDQLPGLTSQGVYPPPIRLSFRRTGCG